MATNDDWRQAWDAGMALHTNEPHAVHQLPDGWISPAQLHDGDRVRLYSGRLGVVVPDAPDYGLVEVVTVRFDDGATETVSMHELLVRG